jgi:hypothetical protein
MRGVWNGPIQKEKGEKARSGVTTITLGLEEVKEVV